MSDRITIPDGAYVLVADGTGGRLFSASVDGGKVALEQIDELEPQEEKFDGPSGVRPPEQTGQQTDEATFAKQTAEALYGLAHEGKFRELVVIADPQTLGQMRGIFHQEVANRIVAEIPKTLTNLSQGDLEQRLSHG